MLEEGTIVLSLSGHDKDKFYVVVRAEEKFCYIANGKRRPLSRPKKKNFRHLRATNKKVRPDEIGSDRALRRVLAQLCQEPPDPSSTREESCRCPSKMSSK